MLDEPRIVETERQETAVIRLTVPRAEIQKVMGPAIAEVLGALAAQGVAPAGPVFSHHVRMSPDVFDFEVGVPVAAPVKPVGRVQASELAAAKVARTVYRGPYEGLATAWPELTAWIEAAGHRPAANLWEVYAAGPESSPDPASWRTELNRPLLD
ncbi:MAG: GyrI-like domain-containing protein [Myxococcales bacterium]|nr:GyrI-like domain-containing protein [Myxococcales bacterium]